MQKQHSSSTGVMWQIADEGWPVLALAGFITILLTIIYTPLGTFALGLIVWLAHILRVPHRQSPDDDDAILAPADGRVIDIADSHYPDAAADRPAIRSVSVQRSAMRNCNAPRLRDKSSTIFPCRGCFTRSMIWNWFVSIMSVAKSPCSTQAAMT